MTEAYIFDTLRTPRGKGKAGGALYEVKPIELLSNLLHALQERNQLDTNQVDDAIIGCVTPIGDQGADIAKAALLYAGWSENVPGIQLNRFCSSGLEAVNLAAVKVRSGWEQLIVAGGVESMSRVQMGSDGGALIFDPEVSTKINYVPQGISADLIATIEGLSREALDEFALRSQQLAYNAWTQGYFKNSIVPIYDKNGLLVLDRDEHMRPGTELGALGNLRPAFEKLGLVGFDAIALKRYPAVEQINHVHTAGNSSGIVDGAALALVGSKAIGQSLGLKARAKIRAAAVVGTEPTIMLTGPTPASKKALAQAGMSVEDIDLWEINEAFASVVLQTQRNLSIDQDKINVNGGAIAMGHPLGATGTMLLGTLLDELERRDLSTGAVTMCIGGGMGIATIIERV
jgi:acetyl-CoA C-acetyltransferase